MEAVIIAIGDELVLGQTVDTNSGYLSARLAERGIGTLYHQTIGDDREAIAGAIDRGCQLAPLLIITGGLGPTEDDLTRHALADALGVELVIDEPTLDVIRGFMERRGRKMAPINEVQAMHPAGTQVIPNDCGTAPGIKASLHDATIYVTPGVPREMHAMFEQAIAPALDAIAPSGSAIFTGKVNTFGDGESNVGEALGDLCDRTRNPLVGTTVTGGVVSVRVRSRFDDPASARKALEQTMAEVEATLGPIAFSRDDVTLQETVIGKLREAKLTIATAESCTGGLIGKMFTDVPGSSDAYAGGWVTYSNQMKIQQLGVTPEAIQKHGAVSREVVRQMAEGAMERSGADLAVAITGIAGPDGGTSDKPVGTVWIGLAFRNSNADVQVEARCLLMSGTRPLIRDRAAKSALQLVRLHLIDQPLDLLRWAYKDLPGKKP